MWNKLFLTILASLLILVGCAKPIPDWARPEKVETLPEYTPPAVLTPSPKVEDITPTPPGVTPLLKEPTPPAQPTPFIAYKEPPINVNWISPGKVQVGNFYPGARAEWNLILNNGGIGIEYKKVTTDPGETTGTISLDSNFLKFVEVVSDNPKDKLVLVSEGRKEVTLSGFEPNASRFISINYIRRISKFSIQYRHPDYTDEGYVPAPKGAKDWVIIYDPTPVFESSGKRNILIAVDLPKNVKDLPPKWEFWIGVSDISSGGTVTTEMASRWLVQMR